MAELPTDEVQAIVKGLLASHDTERVNLDRINRYLQGEAGAPEIPEGSIQEIKTLAGMAIKNALGLVVNSFTENLSCRGYHRADATDNEPVWSVWMKNRMPSRQAEVHRAALTYGVSYVTVLPGEDGPVFRTSSPRQMIAMYSDPTIDLFPKYALELYVGNIDGKARKLGTFIDKENVYALDLGPTSNPSASKHPTIIAAPTPHKAKYNGKPVTPVVRFVNSYNAEQTVVGEVEPLIVQQKAINQVNFDRLLVARFGAFPHKILTGVDLGPEDQMISSAATVTVIPDADAKVQSFPAASLEPYNGLLKEMMAHIAMVAQISPTHVTGDMVNLSADAIAKADENHQRKLRSKQESFGDSWVTVLRLAAEYDGDDVTAADAEAVISWRSTESRTLGQVGDFIQKAGASGIPVTDLLQMIPGMTQQEIVAIKNKMNNEQDMGNLIEGLTQMGSGTPAPVVVADPDEIRKKADAMGVLIRAGVSAESAAEQVGMAGLVFTGAVPTSLRLPESEALDLEGA